MLLLVVIVVVGPRRLPEYTRRLTRLVRQLRLFLDNAKEQIAQEVGPELGELNLEDLNPRNYDPRKIVRDALGEDLDAIRRDLSTPSFRSAASTAVRTGDEVVAAARGTKSLSTMIDDEAARTRGRERAGAVSAAAPEQARTPEPASPEPVGPEPAEPEPAPAPEAAAPAEPEPARVPSSLAADRPAAPARPVSPRDIVRAARAAARTRPEAAVAVVDA